MENEFLEIYNEYKNDIYRLALSYTKNIADSEDIVQNVFTKYYRKMDKIDKLHTKNWLFKVAINECKTNFMSFWKRRTVELKEDVIDIKNDNAQEKIDFLNQLSHLSKQDSLIMHLYYYEGLKVKEISQLLKISESNVKIKLYRCRSALKKLLEEEYKDE